MISPDNFLLERASEARRPEPVRDTTQTFVRLAEIRSDPLVTGPADDVQQAGGSRRVRGVVARLVGRMRR